MNFEEMARKTKAELFDILKEKQAEIDRLKKLMNDVLDSSAQTAAIASQMKSESSPEIIESEREMNALLTEENLQLQSEMERLKAQLECCRKENAVLLGKVGELQNRLKAVYALSRMRASVISSWKREELSIKVRKAISYLAKKEKALRGEHE
ncbi:hypothetical protein ACINWCA157_1455 [Acinetobacter radioresistens WC-A-157]|uniref:hypothetical protein n=1 Tax=Acinetobacter radioresistens TaxID=40216 RepID=UPI000277BFBE|nr:hypothetical protein [Acinetobacter radioresistens]EJO35720.1 hypothetical protein ACINWCA157_1455 [Acinetobacter radioresistens WC-A-157]